MAVATLILFSLSLLAVGRIVSPGGLQFGHLLVLAARMDAASAQARAMPPGISTRYYLNHRLHVPPTTTYSGAIGCWVVAIRLGTFVGAVGVADLSEAQRMVPAAP